MSKKSIKLNIKGIDWTFFLQSDRVYAREHGKDSDGISYPGDKEVYFRKSSLSPVVVRHELNHCFVASSGASSSDLDSSQMEELCSEIVGEHAIHIVDLADKIIETFLK